VHTAGPWAFSAGGVSLGRVSLKKSDDDDDDDVERVERRIVD
jgi:hypothetical protein